MNFLRPGHNIIIMVLLLFIFQRSLTFFNNNSNWRERNIYVYYNKLNRTELHIVVTFGIHFRVSTTT